MTRQERPIAVERGGVIVLEDTGAAIGALRRTNLLQSPPGDCNWPGGRLVTYSGTLASGLYGRDPATWLRPGHEALEALWNELAPRVAAAGGRLCLLPHARHVLSDVQSTAHFHRERPADPLEIALAPAELLEIGMLDDVEVHLTRMFETLGPVASLVILEDVAADPDEQGLPRRRPLGSGLLPRACVLDLVDRCVPRETPIVVSASWLEGDRAWLRGAATKSPD